MLLFSVLPLLILQVGPNPAVDAFPGTPEELRDRPSREQAVPEQPRQQSRLSQCLLSAGNNAEEALDYAQAWRQMAQSDLELAQTSHCAGLALVRLERFDDALRAFVAAREEIGGTNPAYRARLAAMAGNAAMAAGDAQAALVHFESAEADAAEASDGRMRAGFAIDRARALVEAGQNELAVAALASARESDPANARAWLLSATLSRRLERLGEAQRQIEYAADLAPRDPAIGLEAGVIAAMAGREADARSSFDSVIGVAPDSPEAGTARKYLEQLNGKAAPE
ncbi:tetratricopeptide repeat protein [Qipengyuania sp. MTN3-11]|uniref:tetratricopeptide repeat protein n=1 Tax=Qipengyuania sp. MTN3-11 TaxID=3056557 RepID=UPI0036F2854E